MHTEEDLRTTLAMLEGEAPDPGTVLSGLSRLRRRRDARRRATVVAAAAVLVTAVVGGSVALTGQDPPPNSGRQNEHAATAPSDYFRLPFSVGDLPGYEVTYRTANFMGRSSSAWVVAGGFGDGSSIDPYEIHVFGRGDYDPARDRTGEPVLVDGKPGFYRADQACQCSPTPGVPGVPGVAWEYAPGSWALVQYPRVNNEAGFVPPPGIREILLTIANAVRFDRPTPVRVPYRLGYLPAGQRVTGPVDANIYTVTPGSKGVELGYRASGGRVTVSSNDLVARGRPIGAAVLGTGPLGERFVVVNFGDYGVSVSAAGVSDGELLRIGQSITRVADVSDPATWIDAEEALQPG
jgi:hypothetical protein